MENGTANEDITILRILTKNFNFFGAVIFAIAGRAGDVHADCRSTTGPTKKYLVSGQLGSSSSSRSQLTPGQI